MSVTFRGGAGFPVEGVTTNAVTFPTTLQVGDFMFVWIAISGSAPNNVTFSATGFTTITMAWTSGDGGATLLWRYATSTDVTNALASTAYTVTIAGTTYNDGWGTLAGAYSRVVLSSPFNPTPSVGGTPNASSTTVAAAGVTTTLAGDQLLWFGAAGTSSALPTITQPSGYTIRIAQSNTTGAGVNMAVLLADFTQVSSGATGTVSGSLSAAHGNVGFLVALAAAPVLSGATALTGSGTLGGAWEFEETSALAGSGTLSAAGSLVLKQTQALSGSGTLGGSATGGNVAATQALSGNGTLSGTGQIWVFQAALSGSGSMSAMANATYTQTAMLTGTGLLSAGDPVSSIDGEGYLGIAGEVLGFAIGLTGTGTLSVPGLFGGLVSGTGGAATPQALPGSSQVSVAAPGSSNWQWLSTVGQVTALSYGYICPGGCDQMTMTIMAPAAYRTQLFNPGWQVRVTRGGHQVWDGVLDEPVPSAGGWTLTAVGTGNLGTNYLAVYTDTWPSGEPDESVNNAISRGLPWVNPGIGTPSGMWFGQAIDTGAQTVTALLNLVCTRGGLTWYVNSQPGGTSGDNLAVFPLPVTPNRLLVCTTPVARTLGGDINKIFIRYETAADNSSSGAAASYALTSMFNAQSVAMHGPLETYIDLSDVGVMTQAAAQAVASSVLQIYQRASFAGPFTASYGQLLTIGGQAIDPGTEQAGTVIQLILTDFGYGGEVSPQFPISFVVGAYVWDDFAQVATITPYQNIDQSLTGLLSLENTVLTPIAAAS